MPFVPLRFWAATPLPPPNYIPQMAQFISALFDIKNPRTSGNGDLWGFSA